MNLQTFAVSKHQARITVFITPSEPLDILHWERLPTEEARQHEG